MIGSLLPPAVVQAGISFCDAPLVGPSAALSGTVLRVALSSATAGESVPFTAVLHAPQRLKAAQYWTDEERTAASEKIAAQWLARPGGRCRKLYKKAKSTEIARRCAADEVLTVHARFVEQLDILTNLWRRYLCELLAVEDNPDGGEGAELVKGIFPYLDAIASVSAELRETLLGCNRGGHALVSLDDADQSSYVAYLVAHARRLQRRRWDGVSVRPVSYTHLTLPTICSV